MVKKMWIVALLISFYIGQLGSEDWTTRNDAENHLQAMVEIYECPWPVKLAIKNTKDLEVKRRCLRVLRKYEYVEIPERLQLIHFSRDFRRALWNQADRMRPG